MNLRTPLLGLVIVVILFAGSPALAPAAEEARAASQDRSSIQLTLTARTLVGSFGMNVDLLSITVSPDGSHVAYAEKEGEQWAVVRDGVRTKEYDAVSRIAFSGDGRHVAYPAKTGDRTLMVLDDREGPSCDGLAGPWFSFNPDGSKVAYVAFVGKKQRVIVQSAKGAEQGPLYDGVLSESLTFGPDGNRLAYVAIPDTSVARFDYILVLDGVERERRGPILPHRKSHATLEPRSPISSDRVVFSPDGTRWAYGLLTPQGQSVVSADDRGPRDGPPHERIAGIQFSPAGQLVYVAQQDGGQFLMIEGRAEKARGAEVFSPIFSADGKRMAFVVKAGGEHTLVLDGREHGPHEGIGRGSLVFSPDGSRFAYGVQREGRWRVVLIERDGEREEPQRPYAAACSLAFSPDNRHVAYLACSDGHTPDRLVVDGVEWTNGGEFLSSPSFVDPGTIEILTLRRGDLTRNRISIKE
jgi:Tol biopolymer transport system component